MTFIRYIAPELSLGLIAVVTLPLWLPFWLWIELRNWLDLQRWYWELGEAERKRKQAQQSTPGVCDDAS